MSVTACNFCLVSIIHIQSNWPSFDELDLVCSTINQYAKFWSSHAPKISIKIKTFYLSELCHSNLQNSTLKVNIHRKFVLGPTHTNWWTELQHLHIFRTNPMILIEYRKDTSIQQAPVFRHLRVLRKSPWKFIIWMNEL